MTYTYNPPQNGRFPDDVSEVRFLLRDTKEHPWSLDDAEIEYLIAEGGDDADMCLVASWAAESLADSYASKATGTISRTVGNSALSMSQTTGEGWRTLAAQLLKRSNGRRGVTFAGMGLADKGMPQRPRQFAIGMMDNGPAQGSERRP